MSRFRKLALFASGIVLGVILGLHAVYRQQGRVPHG